MTSRPDAVADESCACARVRAVERPVAVRVPEQVLDQLRQMGHSTADEPQPYPSCNGITKLYDQLSSHSDSRGGGTAVRF